MSRVSGFPDAIVQSEPSSAADSADALVPAAARGEPVALQELYRRFHRAVRAFACRLVGDEDDAEELVQEVFVALPSALGSFRADSSLRTFVLSVAVNHARHFVRSAARHRAALERLATHPERASTQRPDEALDRDELARALTLAMDTLPVEQRVAFVLCEVEERPSREAASIVGVPESTLRARVRIAKRRLREALHERGIR